MFPGGVVRQGCVACRQSLAPVPCVRMMAAACKCGARNYVVSSPVVTVLYLCFDPYLKCATGRSYKQREQATANTAQPLFLVGNRIFAEEGMLGHAG